MNDDIGNKGEGSSVLPRKLAAILYADVVGYSALAHKDEEGTHKLLRASLDAIAELVATREGVVVNYAGDAVLADFPTASLALECALNIQKLHSNNQENDGDGHGIQYRVGINLGEVILDRNDVYGDGVNVAARIQGLADPGGICVSDAVVSAIGNKLEYRADDMGLQKVKNIEDPVHVYRVVTDPSAKVGQHPRKKTNGIRRRRPDPHRGDLDFRLGSVDYAA